MSLIVQKTVTKPIRPGRPLYLTLGKTKAMQTMHPAFSFRSPLNHMRITCESHGRAADTQKSRPDSTMLHSNRLAANKIKSTNQWPIFSIGWHLCVWTSRELLDYPGTSISRTAKRKLFNLVFKMKENISTEITFHINLTSTNLLRSPVEKRSWGAKLPIQILSGVHIIGSLNTHTPSLTPRPMDSGCGGLAP